MCVLQVATTFLLVQLEGTSHLVDTSTISYFRPISVRHTENFGSPHSVMHSPTYMS